MKIQKCSNCGKMMIVGRFYGSRCIFCNTSFQADALREPYTKEYRVTEAAEQYLCQSSLSLPQNEIIYFYDTYIASFPAISLLYWCRLLRKNGCRNEKQLLEKGIRFMEDEDFFAAYDCASNEEKIYYDTLIKVYANLQKRLIAETHKQKKQAILATGIRQKQPVMYQQLQQLSAEITKRINIISDIEMRLKNQITDCEAYYELLRVVADSAYADISRLHADVRDKTELSDQKKNEYQRLMEQYLQTSEIAYQKAKTFSSTQMYAGYQNLLQQREKEKEIITKRMEDIQKLDETMKNLTDTVLHIKKNFDDALDQATKSNYDAISVLIGDSKIKENLSDVLVRI